MGYVRLKHTLSALALDALEHRGTRGVVRWLVAYCERFSQPLSVLSVRAQTVLPDTRGPVEGLFHWTEDGPALRAEFHPYFAYMNRQVHRLQAALRTLPGPRTGVRAPEEIVMRQAAALFNHGLFFECHEYLENVWRAAAAAERGFYHGIILIAAAFYHHEKGNLHGTRVKFRQGIAYLTPYLPRAHGIRLDRWMTSLEPWRERIQAGQITGVIAQDQIPKIPLIRPGVCRR